MKSLIIILLMSIFIITSCATSNTTKKNTSKKNISKKSFVSFNAVYKIKDGLPIPNSPLDKSVEYQLRSKPKTQITENFKQKSMICLKTLNNNEFILENNQYFVITRGLASSLGDESMSFSMSSDGSAGNLSFFNGRFLNDFAIFISNKKNKDIKKPTEEISKTENQTANKNSISQSFSKSRFSSSVTSIISQFFKHKGDNYVSCRVYKIEDSIFNKLKDTKSKLSKEEIHNYLDEFIKSKSFKVTTIK